jgi:hypothetical protein
VRLTLAQDHSSLGDVKNGGLIFVSYTNRWYIKMPCDNRFDEAFTYAALRKAESVGRPVESKQWLADMEAKTGMELVRKKPAPSK